MKKEPTEWEKIFANEMTNKGLIPQIYKWPLQFNIKTTKTQFKKWTEDLNNLFFKQDVQMVKEAYEKMHNTINY